MTWLDCLKKDSLALSNFLEVLEEERAMALNRILVSSTPEDEVREMRGYIKALDKLKHLATIEDREKRDYEEYKSSVSGTVRTGIVS